MKGRAPDPVRVVDAIYALDHDRPSWLAALCAAMATECDHGLGVVAMVVQRAADAAPADELVCREVASTGAAPTAHMLAEALCRMQRPWLCANMPSVGSLADMHAWGLLSSEATHRAMQHVARFCGDVAWVRAMNAKTASGVLVATMLPLPKRTRRAQRLRWQRYAAQLSAAHDLRQRLTIPPSHAVAETWQERLVRETPTIACTVEDPFTHLAGGRWSLLGAHEADGREALLIRDNRDGPTDPRALSPRARRVAPLLLRGLSNQEIGYELGVGASAAAAVVREIVRALGVRDRIGAILRMGALRRGGRLAARAEALSIDAHDLICLSWPRVSSRLQDLSPGESAVVDLALEGLSNEEIARLRGRSAKTVANQLAAAFARLEVRSRAELASRILDVR